MEETNWVHVGTLVGIIITGAGAGFAWFAKQLKAERIETKKIAREYTDSLKGTIDRNTEAFRENTQAVKELSADVRNSHVSSRGSK